MTKIQAYRQMREQYKIEATVDTDILSEYHPTSLISSRLLARLSPVQMKILSGLGAAKGNNELARATGLTTREVAVEIGLILMSLNVTIEQVASLKTN